MSKSEQGTILIVDDMPDNIRTLRAFLQTSDFRVLVATNGEEGVETAQYANPDLILLDILMPGMDGFEACQRLKDSPQCRKTPIIFITALSSLEDKLKAFKVGAVDYISKPFYQEEVLARVNTHLKICQLQKKLQQQNEESIQINREKNEFIDIIAHDLQNPLSSVKESVQYTIRCLQENATEDALNRLETADNNLNFISNLIKNLLDINALESGKRPMTIGVANVTPVLQLLVKRYIQRADKKNIALHLQSPEKLCKVVADERGLYQILDNLISNAVKYTLPGGNIFIRVSQHEDKLRCEIQDQGLGLNEADQKKLFGKFVRLSSSPTGNEKATGLGLFIVKKLVQEMQGNVWCETQLEQGSTFIIEFPCAH